MNEDLPKNMKKCPTCNAPVAKNAKVCPNCGAKLKNPVLIIVIIAVVVCLFLCCCGIGVASNNKKDNAGQTTGNTSGQTQEQNQGQTQEQTQEQAQEQTESATPPAPTESLHQIGETFTNGSLEFTVLEYYEQDYFKSNNQFVEDISSDEGTYVVVKVKITNQDSEKRTFDSSMFTLKDSSDRTFDSFFDYRFSYCLDDADSLFLEPCNPGLSKVGYVFFEIPKDLPSYNLNVDSGMLFAGGNTETVHLKG
jgi:lipopolysaccharide export LptBFGC system permease protein LptF